MLYWVTLPLLMTFLIGVGVHSKWDADHLNWVFIEAHIPFFTVFARLDYCKGQRVRVWSPPDKGCPLPAARTCGRCWSWRDGRHSLAFVSVCVLTLKLCTCEAPVVSLCGFIDSTWKGHCLAGVSVSVELYKLVLLLLCYCADLSTSCVSWFVVIHGTGWLWYECKWIDNCRRVVFVMFIDSLMAWICIDL